MIANPRTTETMLTIRSLVMPDGLEDRPMRCDDRGLAHPAEGQGGHGDADLADREVGVEVAQGVAHHAGPDAPLLLELLDARVAHPHQGELGRHEEAVEGHQHQGQREVKPG